MLSSGPESSASKTAPMTEASATPAAKRATGLIIGGALLGLALSVTGILEPAGVFPDHAIARVGDEFIDRAEFDDIVSLMARKRKRPLSAEERRQALEHMIDERLLLSKGVELGLVHADPKLRRGLIGAMSEWVAREMRADEPTEQTLRAFYQEHAAFFSRSARYHLRYMFFARRRDGPRSAERARAASAALRAGQPWDAVAADADITALRVPDAPVPASKLLEYLGPAWLDAALALPIGGISAALPNDDGHAVIAMVDQRESPTPAWETVRDAVRREYHRRADTRRLHEYLAALRQAADIAIADELAP